jgi:hypothetical protein
MLSKPLAAGAFVLAGLTQSTSAVKLNTESEWGLHMMPLNGMGSHEFFLPQISRPEPFGQSLFAFPKFNDFSGFSNIEKNMARMEDHLHNMDEFPAVADNNGNVQSQSFSSSYSSETGQDG